MGTTGLALSRRKVLAGSLALGTVAADSVARRALAAWLPPTPAQPAGPFYAPFKPLSIDSDLAEMPGKAGRARGELIHVMGRLLDPGGKPIRRARIEVWQANVFGRYNHPRHHDSKLPLDPNFQGFGHDLTDDEGRYHFRSIKPGPYSNSATWIRPPHIHFAIFAPKAEPWTTQMYFTGEELNGSDLLLNGIPDPKERARLIVDFKPSPKDGEPDSLTGVFDIVLGTPGVRRRDM